DELIADCFMDQNRGNRRVHPTRQAANHPALADLPADLLDRFVLKRAHRPIARAAGNVAHEVAQDGGAVRGVNDFKMELGRVEPALLVSDHCDRRIGRGADGDKAFGRPRYAIAMAHPYRIALADLPHALIERRRPRDLDFGAAELAMMAA